jgi:hypothetical protein
VVVRRVAELTAAGISGTKLKKATKRARAT